MIPASSLASPSRRVVAGLIDFCILVVFARAIGSFGASSKTSAAMTVILLGFGPPLYQILLHARFGQTIGKRLLGICVRRVDTSPIGPREALLRSSVDVAFSLHWFVVLEIALRELPEASFTNQGWSNLYRSLEPSLPVGFQVISAVAGIWGWSEFVTMLLSEQRRAVHDFLAGTVVLHGKAAA